MGTSTEGWGHILGCGDKGKHEDDTHTRHAIRTSQWGKQNQKAILVYALTAINAPTDDGTVDKFAKALAIAEKKY